MFMYVYTCVFVFCVLGVCGGGGGADSLLGEPCVRCALQACLLQGALALPSLDAPSCVWARTKLSTARRVRLVALDSELNRRFVCELHLWLERLALSPFWRASFCGRRLYAPSQALGFCVECIIRPRRPQPWGDARHCDVDDVWLVSFKGHAVDATRVRESTCAVLAPPWALRTTGALS